MLEDFLPDPRRPWSCEGIQTPCDDQPDHSVLAMRTRTGLRGHEDIARRASTRLLPCGSSLEAGAAGAGLSSRLRGAEGGDCLLVRGFSPGLFYVTGTRPLSSAGAAHITGVASAR